MRFFPILTFCLILIAGCGDSPKAATKNNFSKALDNYFEKKPSMIIPFRRAGVFPVTIDYKPDFPETQRFEALAKIGFIKSTEGTRKTTTFSSDKEEVIPTRTYNLTEEGKTFYIKKKDFVYGTRGGFAVLSYKVKSIDNFSEPSQMLGYTVSEVQFTRLPNSDYTFLSDKSLKTAFPEIAEYGSEESKKAVLVLTNNGWVHEKEMKN